MTGPPSLPFAAAELTEVLVGFLREETAKAGFARGVLGVSGGLDSAVVLLLCARAFGPQNTHAVLMPYRSSATDSLGHGRAIVAVAACRHEVVDISPMVDAFAESCDCRDAHRLGNKMARERMTILYDRSLRDRALVIGTSNKTELMLGYSTRWGDSACDLNPLGDLYKCQVRELARHLGVPAKIIDKPPSADLWPGQTDEDELGLTYDAADRILHFLVDQGGRAEAAAERCGVAPETVRKIATLMKRNQYKRALPLICKVQARTVGIDFRYPRDWGM